jgi:hypothetical protein
VCHWAASGIREGAFVDEKKAGQRVRTGPVIGTISTYETTQSAGLPEAVKGPSIVTVPPYLSFKNNGGKKCVSS